MRRREDEEEAAVVMSAAAMPRRSGEVAAGWEGSLKWPRSFGPTRLCLWRRNLRHPRHPPQLSPCPLNPTTQVVTALPLPPPSPRLPS